RVVGLGHPVRGPVGVPEIGDNHGGQGRDDHAQDDDHHEQFDEREPVVTPARTHVHSGSSVRQGLRSTTSSVSVTCPSMVATCSVSSCTPTSGQALSNEPLDPFGCQNRTSVTDAW